MFELVDDAVVPQVQSSFLSELPLEVRQGCYREFLATFDTPYGTPYADEDVYFLPVLTGTRQQGHLYRQILQVLATCRQVYFEFYNVLFREHAYLVDPDIEDPLWFEATKNHIRKAAITFSVQAGKEKAHLAKQRVRNLASAFEGGRHLSELGIHLWGRWRDATDPEGVLQLIAASFKVPKAWVVDNHVLFGAQFFTDEQLQALKDVVEGSDGEIDWTSIRRRAERRMTSMEKEAEEDPERYKLKPQHRRRASLDDAVEDE